MRPLCSFFICSAFGLLVGACNSGDPFENFCAEGIEESFSPHFSIGCPTQGGDFFIPVKYGCYPDGGGLSPPISWKGVPRGATHLRIIVENVMCSRECNRCCKCNHWVLDIPLKELRETVGGIAEGAFLDPSVQAITLPNSKGKREYTPLCAAKEQTQVYVYKAVAYRLEGIKTVVLGRSQSKPLLFSLDHQPVVDKTSS
ncbi:MAG: hypothetical protein KGZ39_00075 [Simkania sp.]|nr:hypothetical protein [Simkania sp.]